MLPNLSFDLVARNLTRGAFAQLKSDADAADGRLRRLSASLGGFGSSMTKAGAAMTAGVTAPLVMLGRAFVDKASEAQESASAFDALFRDQAKTVRAWADATAKAMGRSTFELQKQAASFQQLFKAAAPTGEAAADLSTKFAALAQDLASFYNVTESDALAKLRSGLSGEAEPMRAFGVFLNEAAVKAKAMEMGLGGVNGALSEQEKILARARLILEATTLAQGDAERTSGSFANKSRALGAAWNDLAVKLGTVLLPAATRFVSILADLVTWFSNLSPATQEWIVIAGGVAAALGPMIGALGTLSLTVVALLPMIPAIGAAFAALAGPVGIAVAAIAAVGAAWAYWDTIRERFPVFAAVVETALSGAQAAFVTFQTAALNFTDVLMAAFSGNFSQAIDIAKTALFDFAQIGPRVFEAMFPGALARAQEAVRSFAAAVVAMKDAAILAVQEMVLAISGWIADRLEAVWNGAAAKIEWVKSKFYGLYDAVVGHSYIPDMVDGIGEWMGRLDAVMVNPALAAADRTAAAFSEVGQSVGSMFGDMGKSIGEAMLGLRSMDDAMVSILKNIAGMAFGSLGGSWGSMLSGLFGGLFAKGGRLGAGKIGVVGEGGPELISSGASPLSITPLQIGGRQAAPVVTINQTVNVNGATGNSEVLGLVRRAVTDAAPSIVEAAKMATFGDMMARPGMLR